MRPKRDAISKPLTWCLEKLGATVQSIDQVGGGCPDVIVGFRGKNYLVEYKSKGGVVSPGQEKWHEQWKGGVAIVWNLKEALDLIGYDLPDHAREALWQSALHKFGLEERKGAIF